MNIPYADDTVFLGPDNQRLSYAILKAHAANSVLAKQRNLLKNLTPDKKKDFYYKAYQILDKQSLNDKADPFLQIGLSPYTFMNEPLQVGGFMTSYGELFSRIHRALIETASTFDFDK